jgi:hypothetical protein
MAATIRKLPGMSGAAVGAIGPGTKMDQTRQNEMVVLGAVMLPSFRSYDIGGSF